MVLTDLLTNRQVAPTALSDLYIDLLIPKEKPILIFNTTETRPKKEYWNNEPTFADLVV